MGGGLAGEGPEGGGEPLGVPGLGGGGGGVFLRPPLPPGVCEHVGGGDGVVQEGPLQTVVFLREKVFECIDRYSQLRF